MKKSKKSISDLMRLIIPEYYMAEEKIFIALDVVLLPREVRLMKRLYLDGWTLRQVGKEFSLSPERIRQIEAKALRKIRNNKARNILIRDMFETISSYVDDEIIRIKGELYKSSVGFLNSLISSKLIAPISSLEFSVRVSNCLASAGIKTVGELVNKRQAELLRLSGKYLE